MTAIIATLGPSTSTATSIKEAVGAGADAFRFSASKFAPDVLSARAVEIRSLAESMGAEVDLLLDLPGSKSRLSNDDGFELAGVSRLKIHFDGREARRDLDLPEVGLTGMSLASAIDVGDVLVLGDGEDALRILEVDHDHCIAQPLTTGVLGRRRGVVIKGKLQQHEPLTEGDIAALATVPATVFTGVILSFVETPDTIEYARSVVRAGSPDGACPPMVVKVETTAGVAAVDDIAAAADAVLLGRGDLLLDVGELEFYELQKRVIKAAIAAGTPAVVGTQVLHSLTKHWMPNRSELVHLCHLLSKGIEGVLLSTETTVGQHPRRTIELIAALRDRYGTHPGRRLFDPAAA